MLPATTGAPRAQSIAAETNPLHDLKAQLELLVAGQVAAKASELQHREVAVEKREKSLEKALLTSSDKLTFDVGGERFTLSTLTLAGLPATWFESVMSPEFKKADDGVVFVDRDPACFRIILDYIRYGVLPPLDNDPVMYHKLKMDADFFGFELLRKALREHKRCKVPVEILSCTSTSMAGPSSKYWNWVIPKGKPALTSFTVESGIIKVLKEGVYLLNVRVHGVSSSNNGCAQIVVNNVAIAQAWNNNANGHHGMMSFNEILVLKADSEIRVEAVNLSSTTQGSALGSSLHLTPVMCLRIREPLSYNSDDDDDIIDAKNIQGAQRAMQYIRLEGKGCSGAGHPFLWIPTPQNSQSADLQCMALLEDGTGVSIKEPGMYMVMARVGGVSSSNNGYADLRKGDVSIAQAWSGDANGHSRSSCFNEIISLAAGDVIKISNVNLTHAYNNKGIGAGLTIMKLGMEQYSG
eukprot:jgi/Mesvir1/8651/Mv02595-RA.1